MIAFKQLLTSDVIVTPLEINKSFTFSGSQFTSSIIGIDRFQGQNINSNPWISGSNPSTGYISKQDQELIYDSVKQLYYSNYISSSYNPNSYIDPLNTASLIPNSVPILVPRNTPVAGVLVGTTQSPGLYDNYLQTTLTFKKYFPTGSDNIIGLLSIPSRLFGDYIQPNSFIATSVSGTIYDDGEGNILLLSGSNPPIVGNIFYGHGMVTLTGTPTLPNTSSNTLGYGYGVYGTTSYGDFADSGLSNKTLIQSFITSSNVTMSFSSSLTIYENQYKCTIRENEFNYTLNPTLQTDSSGSLQSYTTSSQWAPYVTTVGLYDEAQNLLAIGKLSQPLPTSATTDTTILINIDM
jgi:hypothetical protein